MISSLQNPRVKNLVRLRESTHRKRQQRFLVEGFRESERCFSSGWPIETAFFCQSFFQDEASLQFIDNLDKENVELVELGEDAFKKAAFRQNPDGIILVAERNEKSLKDLKLVEHPFLLILEGLEKPGNLGAIFRSANAAGCHAIILCDAHADVFNPSTIRASQGAFFDQVFAFAQVEELKSYLVDHTIQTILMTPSSDQCFWKLKLEESSAFVLGTEDEGLTGEWLEDFRFKKAGIPMNGITDSLNVSVTAGIVMFEKQRQLMSC